MASAATALAGRFRGAILGGAIADALAFPYQHYSRGFLRSIAESLQDGFESHHSGFFPRGQYSDDTQLLLAVVESIIESHGVDGESVASRFVPLFRDNLLVERDTSYGPAMERLVSGGSDWKTSGMDAGHAEIAPAAWCVPVGLWTHADLDRLLPRVEDVTRITHNDPRALACSAATAAGIAHNTRCDQLILGPFLDAMAEAASSYSREIAAAILDFPRLLSMTDYRAWRQFASVLEDDAYPPSADGLDVYCVPSLLTALHCFVKSPHDYLKAVSKCIACGGHIDTPSLITGALVGALRGEDAIPRKLVDNLLDARNITALAQRFYDAWADDQSECVAPEKET